MYRIVRIAIAALASVGMLASVAACGSGRSSSEKNGTIEVVASVNQWGTVAKTLGGGNVNVTSIINSTNVDAHDYEPTTSDIAKLQKAQVIIVNGAGYDAWAVKAAQSANATIVNAAAVGGVNDGENPHVWFSADVRKAVAQAITEAYEQADAAKKSDFDKLHDQWKSEENNVESKIAEVKQKSDGLAYAATESVASYLAEDMGLTDATPSGHARATANESEPTPTDIRQFADALKSGEIKLLIVNTQEESELTGKITNAAKSANVPMVELTEQMPEQYDSLTAWMESLVDAFSQVIA
ncbi:MAG: ABC transporter substrate-binding protein [Bifidobacterium pseudocatenulatum]|nr:MAG: ABC transporter substrate-binding protein [Bifidobacterium pseudocatenulatum]